MGEAVGHRVMRLHRVALRGHRPPGPRARAMAPDHARRVDAPRRDRWGWSAERARSSGRCGGRPRWRRTPPRRSSRARPSCSREVLARNELTIDDLISIIFTMTSDLSAEFPAVAARESGAHARSRSSAPPRSRCRARSSGASGCSCTATPRATARSTTCTCARPASCGPTWRRTPSRAAQAASRRSAPARTRVPWAISCGRRVLVGPVADAPRRGHEDHRRRAEARHEDAVVVGAADHPHARAARPPRRRPRRRRAPPGREVAGSSAFRISSAWPTPRASAASPGGGAHPVEHGVAARRGRCRGCRCPSARAAGCCSRRPARRSAGPPCRPCPARRCRGRPGPPPAPPRPPPRAGRGAAAISTAPAWPPSPESSTRRVAGAAMAVTTPMGTPVALQLRALLDVELDERGVGARRPGGPRRPSPRRPPPRGPRRATSPSASRRRGEPLVADDPGQDAAAQAAEREAGGLLGGEHDQLDGAPRADAGGPQRRGSPRGRRAPRPRRRSGPASGMASMCEPVATAAALGLLALPAGEGVADRVDADGQAGAPPCAPSARPARACRSR